MSSTTVIRVSAPSLNFIEASSSKDFRIFPFPITRNFPIHPDSPKGACISGTYQSLWGRGIYICARSSGGRAVKFGWRLAAGTTTEKSALSPVHPWTPFSSNTTRVASYPFSVIAVVEPRNWIPMGMWNFIMGECHGVPLNIVVDNMFSP
jgi:hypothetical protein